MESISEFYAGRNVFITGATGFMGKVLVEKLLRSCPTVKGLYLMVRPKKGQAPEERVEGLFKSKLFEKIAAEQPDFKSKVFAIRGDILEPGLGLSEEDLNKVINDVSVVFHSAATVKFDEQLKLSIQMNVLGVRELLVIAHKMKKLEAFVHVSTAYANCDRDEVHETVYPPTIDPHKILDSIDWMSVNMFETLTPSMVEPRPNTYTFTKSMAEYLVLTDGKDLPVSIVRPSIVGGSWREPMPGWVDNFNGPTGLFAAIGKGILRTMHGNFHGTADIIPVDIATNLMLAVGWSTAIEGADSLKVYNCTTGQLNKITWGEIERASDAYFMKNPMYEIIRIPNPRFTSSRLWRHFNKFFDHILPAWIMDACLKLAGREPIMSRLQNRLWKSVACLEYFTSKEWHFSNQNVLDLLDQLNQSDRKEFNFDVREIHWPTYLENYICGAKKFVLKEELSKVTEARQRLRSMILRHRAMKFIGCLLAMRFLISRVAVVRNLWQFILSWVLRFVQRLPAITKS